MRPGRGCSSVLAKFACPHRANSDRDDFPVGLLELSEQPRPAAPVAAIVAPIKAPEHTSVLATVPAIIPSVPHAARDLRADRAGPGGL